MKYIYAAVTSTPCFTGRLIRTVTNSDYNHVSLCLDPKLEEMYSFARRYRSTPFCGGFVRESSNRYKQKGRVAKLLLYKIPVSDDEYLDLENKLKKFIHDNSDYVYNNLSAVMSLLHLKMKVKNSYTCVEFASELLSNLESMKPTLTRKFYSIDSLRTALAPFLAYEGPFPVGKHGWGNDSFNQKLSAAKIIHEEYSDGKKLVQNLVFTLFTPDNTNSIGKNKNNKPTKLTKKGGTRK